MAIEASEPRLIRLCRVPREVKWLPRGRGGAQLAPSTLIRWAQTGSGGVRLKCVRVGSALCTSEAWLREFFERLATPDTPANDPTPAQRAASHLRAETELAADRI